MGNDHCWHLNYTSILPITVSSGPDSNCDDAQEAELEDGTL